MNTRMSGGATFADDDAPLIPNQCGGADADLVWTSDESGAVVALSPIHTPPEVVPFIRPCPLQTLNGSWYLQFTPTVPTVLAQIRGPLRIEAGDSVLRASGDIYVKRMVLGPVTPITAAPAPEGLLEPVVPGSLIIRRNWYPSFPQSEYRWYFRSTGCTYTKGKLSFTFERHLWNQAAQEFTATDNGSMELSCSLAMVRPIGAPQPTIEMTGKATIGGRQYNVTATKTSPYYRGCLVEVDVMQNRTFPASATSCDGGRTYTFTGIYREAGLDFRVRMDELNVPDDPQLTMAELHALLAAHRSVSAGGDNWHLWVFVGSRDDGDFGIMFDTGNPPHREGVVGFYDPTLPGWPTIHVDARNKKLGEVPLAFLRTLVHEAGHAFNLYHPKHDCHTVPIGRTIMNQTGDVMSFSTVANPYPCNATMEFNEHNRTSLIHSPDPQVKPGWKAFGWGHGSLWSGVAAPVDALGFEHAPDAKGVRLTLSMPTDVTRGQVVFATATVTNDDTVPRRVYGGLNLAERDLRINVTPPSGAPMEVNDVVLVCGERRLIELKPGESADGTFQLFYTNRGFTFDQPGQYLIQAELDTPEADGSVIRSAPITVVVQQPLGGGERDADGLDLGELLLDKEVGLAFALGNFAPSPVVEGRLTKAMEHYAGTDTGAAAALLLANALAGDFRDLRTGKKLRAADADRAEHALDRALHSREAADVARLSTAVVAAHEVAAPLIGKLQSRLRGAKRDAFAKEDLGAARRILADFVDRGRPQAEE